MPILETSAWGHEMFISIASAPAFTALVATSKYVSLLSPKTLTIRGILCDFISSISEIKLSIPGLPRPTLFRKVPGYNSIIEGFLNPLLGLGPIDLVVIAPIPILINLNIVE